MLRSHLILATTAVVATFALSPTANAQSKTDNTASKAERAVRHTLVRHGLAHDATVTSSAASFRHSQRGRTQVVSCQVSFVLTFTGHQPGVAMKSAKVKGSGTVTSRRRLPLALAKEKCAVTVAKELASTRARRFLVRHSTSWFAQATVE